MTGSDAEAGTSDDEFFEQPEVAGNTNSSAATVANASGRRRGAERGSTLGEVMAWSWIKRPSRRAGELGKTAALGNR
jgi:hypothetical protein